MSCGCLCYARFWRDEQRQPAGPSILPPGPGMPVAFGAFTIHEIPKPSTQPDRGLRVLGVLSYPCAVRAALRGLCDGGHTDGSKGGGKWRVAQASATQCGLTGQIRSRSQLSRGFAGIGQIMQVVLGRRMAYENR